MKEPYERLQLAMKLRGVDSAAELSRLTGVKEVTVRSHVNGSRGSKGIPHAAGVRYCRALKLDPVWLFLGKGTQPGTDGTFEAMPEIERDLDLPVFDKMPQIKEIDVKGSMGDGAAPTFEDAGTDIVKAHWGIPKDYIRSELQTAAGGLYVIAVQGDSMTPTLESGDRVFVDTADKTPSPPGVFVVWDGFGIVVKRVEIVARSKPTAIRVISDNPRHTAYEIEPDEHTIIGRVVGYVRRL